MTTNRPLCFVLMPFGKKAAGGATPIDFDAVYNSVIKPAVVAAGLDPIRADEEETGGIIHKPMFERLVLCDYAIADLTLANANVFYELGVRHAAKSRSTVLLFAEGHGRLPFDVEQLRALPYKLGADGRPERPDGFGEQLTEKLESAKGGMDKDSPRCQDHCCEPEEEGEGDEWLKSIVPCSSPQPSPPHAHIKVTVDEKHHKRRFF